MSEFKFIENINNSLRKGQSGTSKNYIWDELAYSELLIDNREPVSNYMFKDVFVLAKYYHHIQQLNDETIKSRLREFIQINNFHNEIRMRMNAIIQNVIHSCKKQFMKVCHEIRITQNEMNVINNMADSTTRKSAFVLLCMWKANGNKPFRTTIGQASREIGLNANGKKLSNIYFNLKKESSYIYIYNRKVEKRKRILEKLVEVDSQFGQLFIPYDAFKYENHIVYPTRKSSIAIWRYEQDYYEKPHIRLPEYYLNLTDDQKENFKSIRYQVDENEMYGDDLLDQFYDETNLAYIKENIDFIARCYMRDDFARLIGGEVFYSENEAHDKIKVMFADNDCSNGILIDVNKLQEEFESLFGENKVTYGNCHECGCKIVKKSNMTRFCEECKVKVRKEKVKVNMRNMRAKKKEKVII